LPLLTKRPLILKHFANGIYEDLGAIASITGSPSISSAQQRFTGKNSLYLPLGGSVRLVNSSIFNLGTGDFTISFSEYLPVATDWSCSFALSSATYGGILFGLTRTASGNRFLCMSSSVASWDIANNVSLGTIASCLNVWVDWEISRLGNTFYVFKNGVLIQTITSTSPIYYNYDYGFYLGFYGAGYSMTGYIAEFMVSNTCLHTANFTPNTEPYTLSTDPLMGTRIRSQRIGDISNTKPAVIVGKQRIGELATNTKQALILEKQHIGARVTPVRQGYKAINDIKVNRITPVLVGYNPLGNPIKVEKVFTPKQAKVVNIVSTGNVGFRTATRSGKRLKTFEIDSNASNKFKVIVDATHQYKTQTITVTLTTGQDLSGQWSFSVDNIVVIPLGTSESLASIIFKVDPTVLTTGKNNCSLNFVYADGATGFIPLLITKEATKRTLVERTFKNYDGGYTLQDINILSDTYARATGKSSGTIKTTTNTSIDLAHYGGIVNVSANCSGARFLVSFDGASGPWWTFNGTAFVSAVEEDISTVGFDRIQLKNITQAQWQSIFKQTKLDFMVYLDNVSSIATATTTNKVDTTYLVPNMYTCSSVAWTSWGYHSNSTEYDYIIVNTNKGSYTVFSQYFNWIASSRTYSGVYTATPGEYIKSIRFYMTGGDGSTSVFGNAIFNIDPAYLGSINVTLPANLPPVITNVSLTPSTLHSGNAVLAATIADPEEDDFRYRVTINDTDIIPYTNLTSGTTTFETIVLANSCSVGTNVITIEATDGDKISTPYTTYLTRTNFNPNITGVLTGKYLNAVIGDQDGDQIKYRILVNDIVEQGWSSLMDSPIVVNYIIPREKIIVGLQNEVMIEAIDSLGGAGNCDFDFVGQYYGLMFSDEIGNYYSDDVGNTLKTLDLGSFLIGRSSNIQAIVIKNTTGVEIKDIIISADIDSLSDGMTVRFGLTESSFEDLNEAAIPVALGYNDEYTIYVKVTCDEEAAVGNNILKLNAIGVITK
jgi:hypothetical protein